MAKVVGGRHVRHDWQTFVDWEQKSVRTVCGVTTRRHLAGVPGVTPQPQQIPVDGKVVWGWCPRCVIQMMRGVNAYVKENSLILDEVRNLYDRASLEVQDQYDYLRAEAIKRQWRV